MSRNICIKDDSVVNKNICNFLSPDYVYIAYDKKYKLGVKINDRVLKEDIILSNGTDFIYSTVSGSVSGARKMLVDGEVLPTIILENDFEEKTKSLKSSARNISDIDFEVLKNLVYTYTTYRGPLLGETLIISGIDEDPFEHSYSHIISDFFMELLECIDALCNILKIHKCFLAIKNNDSDNVNKLVNSIGTYPSVDLKLMPDVYPIGMKEILVKELVRSSKLDKGIIFLNVLDVLTIYHVLKRRKPITEKLITIGGSALDKTRVVNTKIGTSIKDIIDNCFKVTCDDYMIVTNGLMKGTEVNSLDMLVTPKLRSVFLIKKESVSPTKCNNCGLCNIYCPFECDPKGDYKMDKCNNCGLCSYVCPAKIKLGGKR